MPGLVQSMYNLLASPVEKNHNIAFTKNPSWRNHCYHVNEETNLFKKENSLHPITPTNRIKRKEHTPYYPNKQDQHAKKLHVIFKANNRESSHQLASLLGKLKVINIEVLKIEVHSTFPIVGAVKL